MSEVGGVLEEGMDGDRVCLVSNPVNSQSGKYFLQTFQAVLRKKCLLLFKTTKTQARAENE